MSLQYETVTITIGGATPQTKTVSVGVNPATGSGSASFTYTGTNGGTDTVQGTATIQGSSYTSNTAQVNWQSSNGSIQIGSTVTCYAWGDSPTSGPVSAYIWGSTGSGTPRNITSSGVQSHTNNSLAWDAYVSGVGNSADPVWSTFNSAGSPVSSVSWPPYTQNFNCIILGNILVPAPGNYTLTMTYKDSAMWGIGTSTTGAIPTWSGKGTYTGCVGQTATANSNYPLLSAPCLSSGSGGVIGTGTNVVNFPQAGVYPIELNWDYWYHSGRVLHVTANSAELAPVTLISAPPSSSPSGNLTITPAGGATNLQIANQPITLTVNISGITFAQQSYAPVLEGTAGTLYLYNDPTNNVFNFQSYNGNAVNKTAAAPAVFGLSSADNTAYQGLFSVGFDGTNFTLNYNGNTANPNSTSRVNSTSLIVTADDIAWYNNANQSFDVFVPSGSQGGTSFNFEVDYMNKPSVSSISPTTISANGGSNTLSISLNKAFSPEQQGALNTGNTVNCSCSITGATSTGTPVAVLDSGGWLTGWNVPFTAPVATTNQTLNVNLTVNGTLTYLSGNSFVTNTVTYISGVVGTITANGTSFVPPSAQSFSSVPAGPSISSLTTSMTVTGQVFTTGGNDSVSLNFFSQVSGSSSQVVIGAGVLQSSSPATIGGASGYLQTFTLTFNPNFYISSSPGSNLGFNATDNVSGLTCSYTSTTVYVLASSGGGGGGCPAVDMFVLPTYQVADVDLGTELDAIIFEGEGPIPTLVEKKLPIQWMDFSDEICYRFTAENGAEVIVSETTPVPTREVIESYIAGESPEDLAYLACQIRSGMTVLTNIEGNIEWSMLVETQCVGKRPVARLYIGGENFAAGVKPEKRIYTHNITYGGGGVK